MRLSVCVFFINIYPHQYIYSIIQSIAILLYMTQPNQKDRLLMRVWECRGLLYVCTGASRRFSQYATLLAKPKSHFSIGWVSNESRRRGLTVYFSKLTFDLNAAERECCIASAAEASDSFQYIDIAYQFLFVIFHHLTLYSNPFQITKSMRC